MGSSARDARRFRNSLVGSLVLGIATTVAIAWAGAAFEHTMDRPKILEDLVHGEFSASVHLSRGRLVDHVIVDWREWSPGAGRISSAGLIEAIDASRGSGKARTPGWSKAWLSRQPERPPSAWTGTGNSSLFELAAGWPWRALRCEFDDPVGVPNRNPRAVYTPRRGIWLECLAVSRTGFIVAQPRALPFGIILPGFTANAMLFATLWFAALVGIPGARRAIRKRSGRCLQCGYDLRGQPAAGCPECGSGRAGLESAKLASGG